MVLVVVELDVMLVLVVVVLVVEVLVLSTQLPLQLPSQFASLLWHQTFSGCSYLIEKLQHQVLG